MSILLIILKIIGILFLVILALAAVILVHPIFYRVKGEIEEERQVEGYFWWLFQILRLEFKMENDGLQWRFRIFGICKKSGDEEPDAAREEESGEECSGFLPKTKPEDSKIPASKADVEDGGIPASKADAENGSIPAAKADMESSGVPAAEKAAEDGNHLRADKRRGAKTAAEPPPKTKVRKKKKDGAYKREKHTKKQTFLHWKKELTDERNREAASHLWKEVCYLLAHLKPKDLRAEVSFSAADPAATGLLTGAIALIPVVYHYDAHIYPDFLSEDFYIRGSFALKGHMAIFHFIRSLIRLVLDKNVKRLYDKFRK